MRAIARAFVVLSLLLFGAPVSAQDATLEQAKQLMARRDPTAAYNLLKPLEDERAGSPDFDYLLGIAALDSGHATEAVFALERVLAVNPNHPLARAEIGRAYLQLGEVETSRRQFEAVKKEPIPAEAAATIQKFLDVIEQVQASTRTTVLGYLEAAFGHDSNVNSGTTATSTPAIPGFNPGVITPAAREQSDEFGNIAAGASVRHPVSPSFAWLASVDGTQRLNLDKNDFDQGTIGANLGLELNRSVNKFTLTAQAQRLYFDDRRYRDTVGLVGQWQRQVTSEGVLSAFLQYARLEYVGQSFRDADRSVGGLAYAHAFGGTFAPVGYVSAYYGDEDERDSMRPEQGHRLKGIRLGGQVTFNQRLSAFAHASYEQRDYGGPFAPVFGFPQNREDKQTDLRAGLSYTPAKSWTVTPQVIYTNNDSNVRLTEFDRVQAFIAVRREFR
jgi:tetratricopeptide (TPR) repeat protein